MTENADISRFFDRQIRLAEIGSEGQKKLLGSSVLVIGAGGLGCPALQYLVAAGVGKIGIMDGDVVEESNLHRQLLYSYTDLGLPKAEVAARKLGASFPLVEIAFWPVHLNNENALDRISAYDIILDCTDRLDARYLINDACFICRKPWIYGAVNGFAGQYAVFNSGSGAQYRDLFSVPPDAGSMNSCDENGTIGIIPGTIGLHQATECIKWILGYGSSDMVYTIDLLQNVLYPIQILPAEHENQPKTKEEFLGYSYAAFCNLTEKDEINAEELVKLSANENILIVDVREEEELPVCRLKTTIHVPLKLLDVADLKIPDSGKIIALCQSGNRSKIAVEIVKERYPMAKVYSLKGGMMELKKYLN